MKLICNIINLCASFLCEYILSVDKSQSTGKWQRKRHWNWFMFALTNSRAEAKKRNWAATVNMKILSWIFSHLLSLLAWYKRTLVLIHYSLVCLFNWTRFFFSNATMLEHGTKKSVKEVGQSSEKFIRNAIIGLNTRPNAKINISGLSDCCQ